MRLVAARRVHTPARRRDGGRRGAVHSQQAAKGGPQQQRAIGGPRPERWTGFNMVWTCKELSATPEVMALSLIDGYKE